MEKEGEVAKQGPFMKKDYKEPPPAPFFNVQELKRSSFYIALIAEFVRSLLFLCIVTLTSIGYRDMSDPAKTLRRCNGVGFVGMAWACGGTVFVLVFCTASISGGHINPATTLALLLARKVSLIRAVLYMVVQCLGCICGAGLAKGFQTAHFNRYGGAVNIVKPGYTKGDALGAEIIGTFVLVYTIFSATDPKRRVRDSHIPVLPPLPSGFAILLVHLALIPIDGTSINPARSLGSAVIYNNSKVWHEQWIFWVGPFVGAGIAALYYQSVLRAGAYKAIGSLCSPSDVVVPEVDLGSPPHSGNTHASLSNPFQNKVGVGPTSTPIILHNPIGVAPTFL